MKKLQLSLFFFCLTTITHAQITVTQVGFLPEKVTNNAVCEGYINGTPYLFSFAGLDSTKQYSGIHLRSFRYDITTGVSQQIPDLPDTLGKIAAAASRVGDTIYIAGGYHVFQNGSELSSDKMHRYSISQNIFFTDGADIPVATDDHVQVVWRDSLIYLITGWSNNSNINNVQIYNPSFNTWQTGSSLPNNNFYKSFGASGTIIGDTLYYFGGASSGSGFNIQNQLRKGYINSLNPTQITWSVAQPSPINVGYRMASTAVKGQPHWVGGSNTTYNYNGIAYNGSGGVPPNNRDLTLVNNSWSFVNANEIPMDLRGIAEINDCVKYIAGGMIANQTVTNKIYKLKWKSCFVSVPEFDTLENLMVFPNPFSKVITVKSLDKSLKFTTIEIYNLEGKLIKTKNISAQGEEINMDNLPSGHYTLKVFTNRGVLVKQIVKIDF